MAFFSDLLFAARALRSKPVFTAIAAASLALGIGANTAIFSVVESALLRSLPYESSERLLMVREHQPDVPRASIAPGEFLDYQRQSKTLSGLAAYTWQELTLTGNGDAQKLDAAAVTTNFFEVLGAHAQKGRLFNSVLDKPGQERGAVISDATWRGVFASDPDIAGKTIKLNGNLFRVVGVLRAGENYPEERQVWVTPRFVVPEYVENLRDAKFNLTATYGNHWLVGLGRLRAGVTPAQARAELTIIAKRIGAAHSDSHDHYAVITPLHENLVKQIRPALWILLGAVVLLLLIACANMAGLLLARAGGRTRELAVRVSLGATRAQIIRLLLAESLLLSIVGGVAGILLAQEALHLIDRFIPFQLPQALKPGLNGQVLLFCLGASLLSALLSGLAPAIRSAQVDVQEGLKESSKGSASGQANRARRLLVGAEIACSVVLLSSACLLIHSFAKLLDVNPGFDSTNVTTARISLPLSRYSQAGTSLFWDKLLAQAATLPDVESVALQNYLPMSGSNSTSDITPLGRSAPITAGMIGVSPDVFRAMRIPWYSGHTFTGREKAGTPCSAVVNKAFAEKVFPGQNVIGKQFKGGPCDTLITTIIGVAGDVHMGSLNEPVSPYAYFSLPQFGVDSANLIVRTRGNNANILGALRPVLHSLDPLLPLSDVKPMSEYVSDSLSSQRFLLGLLSVFAALAILLSGIGLYGVLAFSVEQRTRELGIRVALGASPVEVLRLILNECSAMAFGGLAVGLAASFWASSLLGSMMYGVTRADSVSYVAAALFVLAIAAFSSFIPARRAARIDPVIALRYE